MLNDRPSLSHIIRVSGRDEVTEHTKATDLPRSVVTEAGVTVTVRGTSTFNVIVVFSLPATLDTIQVYRPWSCKEVE